MKTTIIRLLLPLAAVLLMANHLVNAHVVLNSTTVKKHTNGTNAAVTTPLANNQTATFLNHTLAAIASGICYREVPTASLIDVGDQHVVGNGTKPTLSRVQFCCDGFRQHPHMRMKCQPVCSKGCTNGICVAPEKCQCYPDHVETLAGGDCQATCPIGCGNGVCGREGCICNTGYRLHSGGKFCVPHCSAGCQNGNCTAPETCVCDAGYALNAAGRCEPVCEGGCAFGRCVSPGRCACDAGYVMADVGLPSACRPVCQKGCNNGRCVAPNVCACEAGWSLDNSGNVCKPTCDRPCLGGSCVAPNVCECRTGYRRDDGNAFKCVPHCSNGCPNGVCTSPEYCLCAKGYVKDRTGDDAQMCVVSVSRRG